MTALQSDPEVTSGHAPALVAAPTVVPPPGAASARVVVLTGPSGSGKTFLANSSGLPVVHLDDFYRPGDDPALPRLANGDVNWESPASWRGDLALAALTELCTTGAVELPVYRISDNRVAGRRTLELAGATTVLAEGIFAAELIAPLRHQGLLADAVLLAPNRWFTYLRRLRRDLRENRDGLFLLIRQGWQKARAEHAVVAALTAQGARRVTTPELKALMSGWLRSGQN